MLASEWYDHLKATKPYTSKSSPMRETNYLYLTHEDGKLWLYVTDGHVQHGRCLGEETGFPEGTWFLSAESLRDWMRYADGEIAFSPSGDHMQVEDDHSSAKILGVDPARMVDFPELPDTSVELPAGCLQQAIERAWRTIEKHPEKPQLESIRLRSDEGRVYVDSACNRGCSCVAFDEELEFDNILIPQRFSDLLRDAPLDGSLKIGFDNRRVSARTDEAVWWTPTVTGAYPHLESVIFDQSGVLEATPWTVEVDEMIKRLRQAQNFAVDDVWRIEWRMDSGRVTIQVENGEEGSFEGSVDATVGDKAEPRTVAVNVKYAIDLFQSADGEVVDLYATPGPSGPVCIKDGDDRFLLMKMR